MPLSRPSPHSHSGHSLTLTLAVLDIARVPPAPVEALIALTIFILAVELARAPARTLMRRKPWAMALVFGFLHGLGFAGTLRQVGLPSDAIPLALLSFNVGIEVGQLTFVLAIVALSGRRVDCSFDSRPGQGSHPSMPWDRSPRSG